MTWVRESGVLVLRRHSRIGLREFIIEDDHLVDAEDRQGSGDDAGQGSFLVV